MTKTVISNYIDILAKTIFVKAVVILKVIMKKDCFVENPNKKIK